MKEIATLAGGCFWCTEAVFQRLKGVEKVVSGYIGGEIDNPSYEEVSTGESGHAEAIEVTFDNEVITYEELLDVFWRTHDPTTLNRQGNDVGTQYRSAIFYHSSEQKAIAERSITEVNAAKIWPDPIVTTIEAAGKFYPAEDYHQDYYNANRLRNPYCVFVIDPKINKLQKDFKDKLR